MKKRTGLALAGGILEIIAGTFLLIYFLWDLLLYTIPNGNGLSVHNWGFLIVFVCLILFGIFAIVGKTKKDLICYGVLNLVYIAFLVYGAITTAPTLSLAIAVILVFSVEIILLLIATIFFFFSKRSEYEIVFNEKLKIYKENEPKENKILKKKFLISSLITLLLMALTPWLGIIGLIISVFLIIGFIVFVNIISKKYATNYNLKTNIGYSAISLFIMFICVMFVAMSYSFTTSNVNVGYPTFRYQLSNTYLYYDNEEGEYLILQGQLETINEENNITEVMIYYANNGEMFEELPNEAIETQIKCSYYDPSTKNNKFAYEYYNLITNQTQYFLESEQLIVDKLPKFEEISNNQQTNLPLMLIIEGLGLLMSITLIFVSNRAQMEIEIKNQMKQEEKKKIYNQYRNIQ